MLVLVGDSVADDALELVPHGRAFVVGIADDGAIGTAAGDLGMGFRDRCFCSSSSVDIFGGSGVATRSPWHRDTRALPEAG